MKNQLIASGSIVKKENLVPLKTNILENTFVSEAANPYANYYGNLPQKAHPNSLFFHTKKFHFLDEVLGFTSDFEKCLQQKLNIATSYISYKNKQFSAIRVKNFPNYAQLATLQKCLISKGFEMAPLIDLNGELDVRINKLFVLQKIEDDIYLDTIEEHKGYIIPAKRFHPEKYDEIIKQIKNNSECKLYDAVFGEIIKDGRVYSIIRIFTEGLDLNLLSYLKERFNRIN